MILQFLFRSDWTLAARGGALKKAVQIAHQFNARITMLNVHREFMDKHEREDMKEPINNLFRVVGTLVSIMLALAFSEVIVELRTIRNAVQREAVAISDTFEVLKLFDIERTREIRTILVEYTQAVINHDWPALANDKLSQRTSTLKGSLLRL